MTETEIRYVMLEKSEAIIGKRDLLSLQMNLLKILRTVKKYQKIRFSELRTKARLFKTAKETISTIKKIQTNIPKLKISLPQTKEKIFGPGKMKKEFSANTETKEERDLEAQLREIQEKLRALQ